MVSILDANIRKYETFQFVTYHFKDLHIHIKKEKLLLSLKKLYHALTEIEVSEKIEEMKQIKGAEVQYVKFYGDFPKRKGFEYIYNTKDSTEETTSSFYMFEQTIAENFHIYFNLLDRKEELKPKRQDHIIEEAVIYMAQYFDETESDYESLFNQALLEVEHLLQSIEVA